MQPKTGTFRVGQCLELSTVQRSFSFQDVPSNTWLRWIPLRKACDTCKTQIVYKPILLGYSGLLWPMQIPTFHPDTHSHTEFDYGTHPRTTTGAFAAERRKPHRRGAAANPTRRSGVSLVPAWGTRSSFLLKKKTHE